ncbi:hypothetical protein ACFSO7_23330 [Bacillus sp. CGMCC 1.16607]
MDKKLNSEEASQELKRAIEDKDVEHINRNSKMSTAEKKMKYNGK